MKNSRQFSLIKSAFGVIALSSGLFLLNFNYTYAVCPVCSIAVGAGVGLSRWLGIDDTISGVWVGGLLVSLIITTDEWLKRKKYDFAGRKLAVIILYYLLTVVPLVFTGLIGHEDNKLWGLDKFLLGMIAGTIVFIGAAALHFSLKEKNGNKVFFPFQKVVIPVSAMLLTSGVFFFITK